LIEPDTGELLDQALILWFPSPGSYTGDDCVELQLHGGPAVVNAVTNCLLKLGIQLAEPGAFTRRAFENGKLDLAQAEAVGDLIDAETEAQRRQALGQLDGELSRRHAAWRAALVESLASLEAAVDFPDEDLPQVIADEAVPLIDKVRLELETALAEGARGDQVREGFRIAVIGAPNAGKSSLLNGLLGRAAAIVTAIPGTTRDIIEAPMTLEGYRLWIADTAGIRGSIDPIEAEGVRRALDWADRAALRLLVIDGAEAGEGWRSAADLARPGDFCILNKSDLPFAAFGAAEWARNQGLLCIGASTSNPEGLEGFRSALSRLVTSSLSGADFPAATRERHRRDIEAACEHLARGLIMLRRGADIELAAEDVRLAARSLARVSGQIDAEDVLDRVFARFCIGK
jgi:tRNA modification GTPase